MCNENTKTDQGGLLFSQGQQGKNGPVDGNGSFKSVSGPKDSVINSA